MTPTAFSEYKLRFITLAAIFGLSAPMLVSGGVQAAEDLPNACPVDGCKVEISSVKKAGDELELTLSASFSPDVSKNHIHVWWGDKFTVKQAGRGAKPVYGVTKGQWHRHDDYPTYVTQGAASVSARDGTSKLCVSAADLDHNIIDVAVYHCVDVADHLQ